MINNLISSAFISTLIAFISTFLMFIINIFLVNTLDTETFGKYSMIRNSIIFFPLLFFGMSYFSKIQRNLLPLLVISIVFFFALSILPVYRSYHFLILLIPFSILNSIFLVDILGRIIAKKNSWRNNLE